MTPARLRALATLALLIGFTTTAHAQGADAAGIVTNIVTWLRTLGIPIWTLGIMITGIACLSGRIHWAWFAAVVCGAILFFAAAAIVQTMAA